MRWTDDKAEEVKAAELYRKLFEAGSTLAVFPKPDGEYQAEQLWI